MSGKKNSPNAGRRSGLGGPAEELDSKLRQLEKEYERSRRAFMKKIVPSTYTILISTPLLIVFALLQLGQTSLAAGAKTLANVSSYVVLGIFCVCVSGYVYNLAIAYLKMQSLNLEITKTKLTLQTVLGYPTRNP